MRPTGAAMVSPQHRVNVHGVQGTHKVAQLAQGVGTKMLLWDSHVGAGRGTTVGPQTKNRLNKGGERSGLGAEGWSMSSNPGDYPPPLLSSPT